MKKENELIVLDEISYPVNMDEIKAFNEKWAEVPALDAAVGLKDETYKKIKAAHLEAVRFRTSIEKQRKHLKAPAIEYGKAVDRIAKELQETINPKEIELFAERNKVEQYEKEQEQKRIEAERKRVEDIANKIFELKAIPGGLIGAPLDAMLKVYEETPIPEAEAFQERLDEAVIAYKETMTKLEVMIDQAKQAEMAEQLQREKDEADRKEREARAAEEAKRAEALRLEREAFEKEKAEFEAMKAAKEEAERVAALEAEMEQAVEEEAEMEQAVEEEVILEKSETVSKDFVDALEDLIEIIGDKYDGNIDNIARNILDCIVEEKVRNIEWTGAL